MVLELTIGGVAAARLVAEHHIRTAFDDLFEAKSRQWGVSSSLLRAIASWEHRDPKRPLTPVFTTRAATAISAQNRNGTRDYGLMQVNNVTGRALGFTTDDLLKPDRCLDAACRLLLALRSELGRSFSITTQIAAYNAGSPAIKAKGIINPEYVSGVSNHLWLFSVGRLFR